MPTDLPVDHDELCARVRFRHDESSRPPDDELRARENFAADHIGKLQGTGIRVTSTLTPRLHSKLVEVCARLLLRETPRLYVRGDAESNATAVSGGKRSVVSVTSGLANLLTLDEFGAVLGHELGHIGMRHCMTEANHPDGHLFLLERSRAAEISCDRLSVIAAGNSDIAVSALLKVCSGLGSNHFTLDVAAFVEQLAERPEEVENEWEALLTHPILPFRVWAMTRFASTDLCQSLTGQAGGEPFEQVENEISVRFKAVGDGLVARAVTDHLHEALAWTGVMVICDNRVETSEELRALTELVGSIWAEDAIAYFKTHGGRAVESRARESLSALQLSGSAVHTRIRSHLQSFISRCAAQRMQPKIDALLAECWKR